MVLAQLIKQTQILRGVFVCCFKRFSLELFILQIVAFKISANLFIPIQLLQGV